MSGMIRQQNARKAEKALKEILNRADSDCNGKVELKEFIEILEAHGVEVNNISRISIHNPLQMDEADLADFTSISDANGEISKTDLIVHTKASSFWCSYMETKSKPGAVTSKVRTAYASEVNETVGQDNLPCDDNLLQPCHM